MDGFLFDGWAGLGRILLVGPLAYVALVVFLRVSGKRALSKMNSFDLVVTVALGSCLATTFLSDRVSLAEGALAFALLLALQYVVTWLSVRSDSFRELVKAEPSLLLHRGVFQYGAMRISRVTEGEVLQAVRASGATSLEEVDVVLETDGSFSVAKATAAGTGPLRDVPSPETRAPTDH